MAEDEPLYSETKIAEIAVGIVLIVYPEPATTATGVFLVADAFGILDAVR